MVNLEFIKKVINSCKTESQKETTYNWVNTLYNQNKFSHDELIIFLNLLNYSSPN